MLRSRSSELTPWLAMPLALQSPGAVLFDLRGKRDTYGVPATSDATCRQTGAELGGASVHVVGTFEMGTDFVSDGNVILSDRNPPGTAPGGPGPRSARHRRFRRRST